MVHLATSFMYSIPPDFESNRWLSNYIVLCVILQTLKIGPLSLLPLYQQSNEARQIMVWSLRFPKTETLFILVFAYYCSAS